MRTATEPGRTGDWTFRDPKSGRWARLTRRDRGSWHLACGVLGEYEASYFNRHYPSTRAEGERMARKWLRTGYASPIY